MKPRHTRPDSNQRLIEQHLQECGFLTYRMCNQSPQKNAFTNITFHPLDLLVCGINRTTQRVELTLWEIKTDRHAPFTDEECTFFRSLTTHFATYPHTAINVAYSAIDILAHYGWIDNHTT